MKRGVNAGGAARLPRPPVILAAALAAAALSASGAGASTAAQLPTLYVKYTMNCAFTIVGDNGQPVTTIAPGTYEVAVSTPQVFAEVDLSGDLGNPNDMTACRSFVQFQLTGSGVSLETTLQDGDEDLGLLEATFRPSSTYTAVDNNQPSVAKYAFSTAASGTPVAPQSVEGTGAGSSNGSPSQDIVGSAIKAKLKGSLDAIVYKSGRLSLTNNGKPVTSLKPGSWTFSVDDESAKTGFSVQVLNGRPQTITTARFVGSHDATVSLKPGRWFFFSGGGKRTTFFVVG